MKNCKPLEVLVLVVLSLSLQPARLVSPASQPARAEQLDCKEVLKQLTRDENWLDQMVDPVLDTQAQVIERLRIYSDVHTCIPAGASTDLLKSVRKLTEYFMIFAGGYQTSRDGSEDYLVNLATLQDPAVISLRQKVGIPPPPGFVYLRLYYTRQAMPDLLQLSFTNPDVKGVTIFTRYVAVLAEKSELQSKSLPKTISHELVHAYLKSVQGVKDLDAFPLWFDEGMAIHFSGSSLPSCVYTDYGTGTLTSCTDSPQDYLQYAANFDFLESKLGQARFMKLVKQSFNEMEADLLYRELDFSTYQDFSEHARDWKKRQDLLTKAAIGGACLVPLIIGLLVYFWRAGQEEAEDTPKPPHYPDLPYQSI
jgi:hypothetical protein